MATITESASTSNNVMTDAVLGALAGVAAVWVQDRIDWFMYNHEDPQARHRTQQVRPYGAAPAQVVANRAAHAMGMELEDPQDSAAGKAIHYSIGATSGVLYGILHGRAPMISKGRGTLFALGLFLLQDEGMNRMLGLSARPSAYPWQAHARGLITHLVYGLALDASLRGLKGVVQSSALPQPSAAPAPAVHGEDEDYIRSAPLVQPRGGEASTRA